MEKVSLIVLMAGFLAGCSTINDDASSHKLEVTYVQECGSIGSLVKTEVHASKDIYLTSKKMWNSPLETGKSQLTDGEYSNLDDLIQKANFFSLEDKYVRERELVGATDVIIEVKDRDKYKKILIEFQSSHPIELDNIMNYLNQLNKEKFSSTS